MRGKPNETHATIAHRRHRNHYQRQWTDIWPATGYIARCSDRKASVWIVFQWRHRQHWTLQRKCVAGSSVTDVAREGTLDGCPVVLQLSKVAAVRFLRH